MTDNEIIKALEECIELRFDDETEYVTVRLDILTNALDPIKRQQAEIERLKLQLAVKDKKIESLYGIAGAIRKQSIEKFAERLKKEAFIDSGYELLYEGTIDNLVKEMTMRKEDEGK